MYDYLWTFPEILKAVDGYGPVTGGVYGIAIDSRETYPGFLFIALPGTETDGHDHVKAALAMGAAAALVSKPPRGVSRDDPRLIWTEDTYKGLLKLAAAARKRSSAKIIAVTGTAGKTGTKDVLADALGLKGPAHASVKSFNNHVGVPLSLARMPRESDFGVFEVGMNQPGDIAPLSKILKPDVALVTTVGGGHAGAFENEAAIAAEKGEIFAGTGANSFAVLGFDNPHFETLKAKAKAGGIKTVLTFSESSEGADAVILKEVLHERCSCLTAKVGDTVMTYKIGMPGRHWVMNSLGVLLATHAAGGDLGLAGLALANMKPQAGRGAIYMIEGPRGTFEVVDESYNANPLSMNAALEVFKGLKPSASGGRKIAVLSDMEELGKNSKAEHETLAPILKEAGVDLLYLKGAGMAALGAKISKDTKVFHLDGNAGIFKKLEQDLIKGDIVLVKGSRSGRLDEVVDQLLALNIEQEAEGWGRAAGGTG